MKKLFLLSLGLLAFSVFAQDNAEITADAAVEVTEEQTDSAQPASSKSALEKMVMEYYFMKQMNNVTKKEEVAKEKASRTNSFLISFRAGGRVGESGKHLLSEFELGGINGNNKFYIGGNGVWGNRIGGVGVNLGMVIPAVENKFILVPGVTGSFIFSSGEDNYYDEHNPRIKDYSFGGAFFKILFGNGEKVFFDITNRVYMTRSQKEVKFRRDYYNGYYYGYDYYYRTSEKIGVSYIGSFGITLLL